MIISELSAATGVSPRSLRYYEQQGLLTSVRGANGYRHYEADAIPVVRTIRTMYDLGFSRQMVQTALPCATGHHDAVDPQAIVETVTQMRDQIADRIDELTQTRETLTRFLEKGVSG